MKIENQDLNINLNLLADVACKKTLLSSKENEVKEFVFGEINKLKEYAIYYNKNIKNLDIEEVNNLIENELLKNENVILPKI